MEWGTLILRKLVGPAISRTIPAIRTARARLIRGRCFDPPRGKTYILLPDGVDYECASQIGAMLDSLWYAAERDWELVRTRAGEPLHEKFTRADLICLGGPGQNSLVREILREHPDLLQTVRHHDGVAGPEFRWLDHAFRADAETDFALVAVKRNPLTGDPRRRLVLIMGLGDAGTLAGATFYANARHARERREVQRAAGTLQGNLEVLLHAGHSAGRGESLRVRPAPRACQTLSLPGGEDLNSVEVSAHAGPNVDTVTVTIRFDFPDAAFQVFERFPLENAESGDAPGNGARTRRRTYGIHTPYQVRLADVPPGTAFEFRIVRVPQPDSPRA